MSFAGNRRDRRGGRDRRKSITVMAPGTPEVAPPGRERPISRGYGFKPPKPGKRPFPSGKPHTESVQARRPPKTPLLTEKQLLADTPKEMTSQRDDLARYFKAQTTPETVAATPAPRGSVLRSRRRTPPPAAFTEMRELARGFAREHQLSPRSRAQIGVPTSPHVTAIDQQSHFLGHQARETDENPTRFEHTGGIPRLGGEAPLNTSSFESPAQEPAKPLSPLGSPAFGLTQAGEAKEDDPHAPERVPVEAAQEDFPEQAEAVPALEFGTPVKQEPSPLRMQTVEREKIDKRISAVETGLVPETELHSVATERIATEQGRGVSLGQRRQMEEL